MKMIAGVFLLVSLTMLVFGGMYAVQLGHDDAATAIESDNNTNLEATNQAVESVFILNSSIPVLFLLLVVMALAGMLWVSIK